MPQISFVIPVYKVGKYIENSMKSVCYQTFKDFEVVLVDNNTPDDSIEIAERVLRQGGIEYRVVKQPIQGLPAARNLGILEAKGEWVISIDPDDTISSHFLEELIGCAIENQLDFVFSKYDEVGPERLFDFPEENIEGVTKIYARDEILNLLLIRRLPLMISNMFFRKEAFIRIGCWFDEDVILGADLINLWRILINTEQIAYINKYLYNHFCRPDSLMTAPSWVKIDSNLVGYTRLREYITEKESVALAGWVYARAVFAFLSTLCIFGGEGMYKEYIKRYYNEEIHSLLQSFPDKRIQNLDRVLNLSPCCFYMINRFLRNPKSSMWRIIAKSLRK